MKPSTLDGLPGVGEVRIRRRSEESREYRGVFAFPKEHEARIAELVEDRTQVVFEGIIEGRRMCLDVVLTDVSLKAGLANFQGVGEPYDGDRAAGSG